MFILGRERLYESNKRSRVSATRSSLLGVDPNSDAVRQTFDNLNKDKDAKKEANEKKDKDEKKLFVSVKQKRKMSIYRSCLLFSFKRVQHSF